MRKLLWMLLAVALLGYGPSVSPAQTASAAASKPVLTVSFAGYNALRAQLEAIGKLAGNPRLPDQYEALLVVLTKGRGLAGLDAARPWGLVAMSDGWEQTPSQFGWLAFLPATDLRQLAALVRDPKTGQPLAPGDDGVVVIGSASIFGAKLYAVQKGQWAYVAPSREVLAKAPADPLPLLGGLEKQYLLAVRLSAQNIPPAMRKKAVDMLEFGMKVRLIPRQGEGREQYAARAAATQKLFQGVVAFFNDLDEVLYGLSVDAGRGTALLDCRVTATPGSPTAAKLSAKGLPSEFAAFALPDAAVSANIACPLDDDDVARGKAVLAAFQAKAAHELENDPKDEAESAKAFWADVVGVAGKTLDGKKLDWGLSAALKPHASAVVVGGLIADGPTLDKAVRRLAALVGKTRPGLDVRVQLDAESIGDVRLHVFTQTFSEEVSMPLAIGKEVEWVVGISGERLYLGWGTGARKLLKETIAKASGAAATDGPPVRISASGKAIAEFVAAGGPESTPSPAKAATYARVLQEPAGKDHLVYTVAPTTNGVNLRLEAEEGLLKLLGTCLNFAPPGGKPARPAEKEESPF